MKPGVLVEARGVDVQVGGSLVLHALNFKIHPGERVALLGHNGAGKSSLLKALTGFASVSAGSLQVLGCEISGGVRPRVLRQLRRQVAQVHQGLHLVDRLTALDNVLIGAAGRQVSPLIWLRHWPRAERRAAHAALERVGLGWAAARRTDSLSGGERQKLAMARALLQMAVPGLAHTDAAPQGRPVLLLADEPTASLDADAAAAVLALLAEVATERQATLLCVTHDLLAVTQLAQRALVLRRGVLVADLAVSADSSQELRPWLT